MSLFVRQQGRPFLSLPKHEDLVVLKELMEAGKVKPVIDKTYPLSDTLRLSGISERDTLQGKVVITV